MNKPLSWDGGVGVLVSLCMEREVKGNKRKSEKEMKIKGNEMKKERK